MARIAVVTGSNKGIGFSIVKALCKQFKNDGIVYLTARNVELGKQAIEKLNEEGLKPHFHQLEIDNKESVRAFASYLKEKHGGIDILINNAAILLYPNETTPLHDQAEQTMKINYFATLNVCDELFPLLKPHARVVNVSSLLGVLKMIKNEEIRKKLLDPSLTIETVSTIIQQYIQATKENKQESLGFPNTEYAAYSVSKVGLTAVSFVQQRNFDKENDRVDIIVNACCPGYCATDINKHSGPLTADQGAETPVYLALLPQNAETRGKFVSEKKVFDWENDSVY